MIDKAMKILFNMDAKGQENMIRALQAVREELKITSNDINSVSQSLGQSSESMSKTVQYFQNFNKPLNEFVGTLMGLSSTFSKTAANMASDTFWKSQATQIDTLHKKLLETKQEAKLLMDQMSSSDFKFRSPEDQKGVQNRFIATSAQEKAYDAEIFAKKVGEVFNKLGYEKTGVQVATGQIAPEAAMVSQLLKSLGTIGGTVGGAFALANKATDLVYNVPVRQEIAQYQLGTAAANEAASGDLTRSIVRQKNLGLTGQYRQGKGLLPWMAQYGINFITSPLENLMTGGDAAMTRTMAAQEEIDKAQYQYLGQAASLHLRQGSLLMEQERMTTYRDVANNLQQLRREGVTTDMAGRYGQILARYGVGMQGVGSSAFKMFRDYGVDERQAAILAMGRGRNPSDANYEMNQIAAAASTAGISPSRGDLGLLQSIQAAGANVIEQNNWQRTTDLGSTSKYFASAVNAAITNTQTGNTLNDAGIRNQVGQQAIETAQKRLQDFNTPFNLRRMLMMNTLGQAGVSATAANYIAENWGDTNERGRIQKTLQSMGKGDLFDKINQGDIEGFGSIAKLQANALGEFGKVYSKQEGFNLGEAITLGTKGKLMTQAAKGALKEGTSADAEFASGTDKTTLVKQQEAEASRENILVKAFQKSSTDIVDAIKASTQDFSNAVNQRIEQEKAKTALELEAQKAQTRVIQNSQRGPGWGRSKDSP